jgi:hypothetical protein
MKKPKENARAKDKKETADYLVDVGGLTQAEANKLAKVQVAATNEQVADSVKEGIK